MSQFVQQNEAKCIQENMEKTVKILHILHNTCHILEIQKFTCKRLILIHINLCCKVHVVFKSR